MKKVFSFGIAVITSLFLLGCGPSKVNQNNGFQSNPPFKVVEATYIKSIGTKPGVKGISIYITIDNTEVKLETVYFRNNSTKLELDNSISKTSYVGNLVMPNTENDIQLHSDSKREFGNQAPDISQKIPFQLKANEAVVSYFFKNEIHYFKILNLIEISE